MGKARASKPVFTSFVLLKTLLATFWKSIFFITRILSLKVATLHAAPCLQSKFPLTFFFLRFLCYGKLYCSVTLFSWHLTSVIYNNPFQISVFPSSDVLGKQLPSLPIFCYCCFFSHSLEEVLIPAREGPPADLRYIHPLRSSVFKQFPFCLFQCSLSSSSATSFSDLQRSGFRVSQ